MQCHTDKQLGRSHLIGLLDAAKHKTAERPAAGYLVGGDLFTGRGKVSYEIVHRDDKELKEGMAKRSIFIVCEETTFEMA